MDPGTRIVRPEPFQRFGIPLLLMIGAIALAFVTASGGGSEASTSSGSDDGSVVSILVPAGAAVMAIVLALSGLIDKVEIDRARIRITTLAGFREVARSSVTGLVRAKGKYDAQHLALAPATELIKASRLRPNDRPTWTEADRLDLPGFGLDEIAEALDLPEPPLRPRFEGPDAAEVRKDLITMFWSDGKPGYFLYALVIALVLCAACVIWGTASGTGPIAGAP